MLERTSLIVNFAIFQISSAMSPTKDAASLALEGREATPLSCTKRLTTGVISSTASFACSLRCSIPHLVTSTKESLTKDPSSLDSPYYRFVKVICTSRTSNHILISRHANYTRQILYTHERSSETT